MPLRSCSWAAAWQVPWGAPVLKNLRPNDISMSHGRELIVEATWSIRNATVSKCLRLATFGMRTCKLQRSAICPQMAWQEPNDLGARDSHAFVRPPNAFQQKGSSIKHNNPHFEFSLVAVVFRGSYSTHALVNAEPVFGCGRYLLLLRPAECSVSAAWSCKLRRALLTS